MNAKGKQRKARSDPSRIWAEYQYREEEVCLKDTDHSHQSSVKSRVLTVDCNDEQVDVIAEILKSHH